MTGYRSPHAHRHHGSQRQRRLRPRPTAGRRRRARAGRGRPAPTDERRVAPADGVGGRSTSPTTGHRSAEGRLRGRRRRRAPGVGLPALAPSRPTCGRSASAAPGASSTPWWPRASPHLVHMSSVGAYSPKRDDAPVDETWPTDGVPTSTYSRHKAAAERLLDELEVDAPDVTVTRLRPGIIGQRGAGSALLRYGLPGHRPGRAARGTCRCCRSTGARDPDGARRRRRRRRRPGARPARAGRVQPGRRAARHRPGRRRRPRRPLVHVPSAAARPPCRRAGTRGCSPSTPAGSTWATPCRCSTRPGADASWAGRRRHGRDLRAGRDPRRHAGHCLVGHAGPATPHRCRWPGPRAASWPGQLSPGAVSNTRVAPGRTRRRPGVPPPARHRSPRGPSRGAHGGAPRPLLRGTRPPRTHPRRRARSTHPSAPCQRAPGCGCTSRRRCRRPPTAPAHRLGERVVDDVRPVAGVAGKSGHQLLEPPVEHRLVGRLRDPRATRAVRRPPAVPRARAP